MRGLSLTQPWASLVAIGAKKWETRSWPTSYRGTIAIHASKAYPRDCRELEYEEPFLAALKCGMSGREHALPTASIVALATLTGCQPTRKFVCNPGLKAEHNILISHDEFEFGDYSEGRFAFKIEDAIQLATPIPCRGALSIWTVPDEVIAAIYMQITDMRHDEAVRAEARGEVASV
jgi:hypothetical protein